MERFVKMNALISKNRSFLSVIGISAILLLLSSSLVFLMVPFASADSAGGASSSNAPIANGIIVQKAAPAGYEINSSSSGHVVSVQANWTVPIVKCAASGTSLEVGIFVAHLYDADSGSLVVIACSGAPPTPGYTIYYVGNSKAENPLPSKDTVSAGDKMYTQASVDPLGGETSVYIQDFTRHWTFGTSGSEQIDTTKPGYAWWAIGSSNSGTSTNPLPQFSTVKFANVKATIDGHTGYIGSFISKFTVTKWIFWNNINGHILAKPTSITTSSTSFSVKWVQGS
jgi:hypothetical protein